MTFECEPGYAAKAQARNAPQARHHATEPRRRKLQAGDSAIQRPHYLEDEIYRAFGWARELGFRKSTSTSSPAWSAKVGTTGNAASRKPSNSAPDCVTIYQMELPYNTVFSKELKVLGNDEPSMGVADWPTKRARG